MKLAKVPKIGDIIKFKSGYTFTHGPNQPIQHNYGFGGTSGQTITIGTTTSTYIEVVKGTLAEVIDRIFVEPHDGISDNLSMSLVISVLIDENPVFFKFNYSIHNNLIEIIKPSKATKLLFSR